MTRNIKVHSRAPLRIGLGGGGTDVAPYCDEYGGAVLSISIKKYCYTKVETNLTNLIEYVSFDQKIEEQFSIEKFLGDFEPRDSKSALITGCIKYFFKEFDIYPGSGIRVSTFADAPKGSGLGTSSTLVVSMLAALCRTYGIILDEYDLAKHAFKLEREYLNLSGGYQDQFAAVFGGINLITKCDGEFLVEQLKIRAPMVRELESCLKLFYTGVSRDSAQIIDSQIKATKDFNRLEAMHRLKLEAHEMKKCLLHMDSTGLVKSMISGWMAKKETSDKIITPAIEKLFSAFLSSGVRAGKISGAGGGGFMLLFVPLANLTDVRELASRYGLLEDMSIEMNGVETW